MKIQKIRYGAAVIALISLISAGNAFAWDRTWRFVSPSFNPLSLSGAYLQFTAEVTAPQDGGAGGLGDIDAVLDDVLDDIETFVLDIQTGVGNIEIGDTGTDTPTIEIPTIDLN